MNEQRKCGQRTRSSDTPQVFGRQTVLSQRETKCSTNMVFLANVTQHPLTNAPCSNQTQTRSRHFARHCVPRVHYLIREQEWIWPCSARYCDRQTRSPTSCWVAHIVVTFALFPARVAHYLHKAQHCENESTDRRLQRPKHARSLQPNMLHAHEIVAFYTSLFHRPNVAFNDHICYKILVLAAAIC